MYAIAIRDDAQDESRLISILFISLAFITLIACGAVRWSLRKSDAGSAVSKKVTFDLFIAASVIDIAHQIYRLSRNEHLVLAEDAVFTLCLMGYAILLSVAQHVANAEDPSNINVDTLPAARRNMLIFVVACQAMPCMLIRVAFTELDENVATSHTLWFSYFGLCVVLLNVAFQSALLKISRRNKREQLESVRSTPIVSPFSTLAGAPPPPSSAETVTPPPQPMGVRVLKAVVVVTAVLSLVFVFLILFGAGLGWFNNDDNTRWRFIAFLHGCEAFAQLDIVVVHLIGERNAPSDKAESIGPGSGNMPHKVSPTIRIHNSYSGSAEADASEHGQDQQHELTSWVSTHQALPFEGFSPTGANRALELPHACSIEMHRRMRSQRSRSARSDGFVEV